MDVTAANKPPTRMACPPRPGQVLSPAPAAERYRKSHSHRRRPAGSFLGDFRTPLGARNSSRHRTGGFGVCRRRKPTFVRYGVRQEAMIAVKSKAVHPARQDRAPPSLATLARGRPCWNWSALWTCSKQRGLLQHEAGESDEVQACERSGVAFVVFDEAAEAGGPGSRALHHPAPRQQHEATPIVWQLNRFQADTLFACRLDRFVNGVTLADIGKINAVLGVRLHCVGEPVHLRAVVDAGGDDVQGDEVTGATGCSYCGSPIGGGSTICKVIYSGSAWIEG